MNHSFINQVLRWVFTALGVVVATRLVPGIRYDDTLTLVVLVLLLSFLNAALRPLLLLFTLPFIIMTAGIGVIVVNALIFLFVGKIVSGFHIDGFWPALWGSLIVSLTSMVLNSVFRTSPNQQRRRPPQQGKTPPPKGNGGDVIDI